MCSDSASSVPRRVRSAHRTDPVRGVWDGVLPRSTARENETKPGLSDEGSEAPCTAGTPISSQTHPSSRCVIRPSRPMSPRLARWLKGCLPPNSRCRFSSISTFRTASAIRAEFPSETRPFIMSCFGITTAYAGSPVLAYVFRGVQLTAFGHGRVGGPVSSIEVNIPFTGHDIRPNPLERKHFPLLAGMSPISVCLNRVCRPGRPRVKSCCIRPRLTTCTWSMTACVFSIASVHRGEDGGNLALLREWRVMQ